MPIDEDIIKLYKKGKSPKKISKLFSIDLKNVRNIIQKWKYELKKKGKKYTNYDRDSVERMFKNNTTIDEIVNITHYKKNTIKSYIYQYKKNNELK